MSLREKFFVLILMLSANVRQNLAGRSESSPADILFLIDGSGSVKPHNFDRLRVMLKDIVDGLRINPRDGYNVALIQFSSRELTKVEFNLDKYTNADDIKEAIDNMVYQRKYTFTGHALKMVENEVFNGKGGDRPLARNIVLLFTDGHAADPHIAKASTKRMKSRGDHMMTVGFGPKRSINRFKSELEELSSNKEKDVFLDGFDDKDNIVRRMFEASQPRYDCSVKPCQHGATCKNTGDSFTCFCTEDWEGVTCEKKKGLCSKKPCLHGGVCEETSDDFKCLCNELYHGKRCEKKKVVCKQKHADVLFIMDDSRSIADPDYEKMKNFVIELVYRFNISRDQSRVSLIQFSDKGKTFVNFHLDRYYDKNSLMNRIKSIKQRNGDSTLTDLALKMAREKVFNENQGDRKDVRNVIILLTDGQAQNNDDTIREATLLRDSDVSIISIGIGKGIENDAFFYQLVAISGRDYVFKANFSELDLILDGVTTAACENLQDT